MNLESAMKGLALIAILGGITRIGMVPSALIWGVDSMPELIFGMLACLFMGIGVFGLYMHQANRMGAAGFLSVVIISISSTLTAALVWSNMLGMKGEMHAYIGTMQGINSLLALIGMIGFSVMTLRARIYPAWTIILFLLFPVLSFIPGLADWAAAFWGASYVAMGWYAFANRTVKQAATFAA